MKEKFNFKAHKDELEDIDISPDKKVALTVCSERYIRAEAYSVYSNLIFSLFLL